MSEWRKLNNLTNYSVFNEGVIKNDTTGKILKPWVSKNGYLYVNPSNKGVIHRLLVHRVVAETFISNPTNKPQVNHINGDKTDNRVENLEWCTSSENHIHRSRVLGIKRDEKHMKNMCELAKKSHYKPVICVETGEIYDSVHEAAKSVNKNPCSIVDVLKGRHKTCGGFTWKYYKELCIDV